MPEIVDVSIVGAGPYGLSLATHLRARGISYRIFGRSMDFWLSHMPKGMCLKSDGFASNLFDPEGHYTLQQYCQEQKIEYIDKDFPIRLDTFTNYGLAFQCRLVPDLQNNMVVALSRDGNGFSLRLDNDEVVRSRAVVIAVGIGYFEYVPASLTHLSGEFLSHSSRHHELSAFKGRRVAVIGAGASAIDLAALLHEEGADVNLIARVPSLYIHDKDVETRSWWDNVRRPISGIGRGWKALFLERAPWLFHEFPEKLRLRIVRRTLGPAGGWFMKDRVLGQVPLVLDHTPEGARVQNGRVHLDLRASDGSQQEIIADHVIAATGYRVDVTRLNFLSSDIQSNVAMVENTPVLSSKLESSIPGLYFIGTVAANSFGPLMRFACGAGFTARRLTKALESSLLRQ